MNQQTITPATELSFKDYLFKNKRNRTILWLAAAAIIIQFAIFKYLYPFASYIHGDSFAYLETSAKNLSINTYMIGYSMFMRIFSVLTKSDTSLVAAQYLLMQGSSLLFLFTLFYFYRPNKIVQAILYCFIVFNPLFLVMGNLISSDSLFFSLSFLWLTILLWIIYHPKLKLIILHTIVIFFAFTVRYNALIYLFIATLAFILSKQSFRFKLAGILSSVIVIGIFVLHTGNQYKTLTGTWQYSPFAGWQLANNAMYAYRYVDNTHRYAVPSKLKKLDDQIRAYFDSTRDISKNPQEAEMAGTSYMWDYRLPLFQYRDRIYKQDTSSSKLRKWASMGPLYKEYGIFIIKQYPWHFAKYYLWPNAHQYFAPSGEFLSTYNSGKNQVDSIAKSWFGYKSQYVWTRTKDLKINIIQFYHILSGIANVVFALGLLSFIFLGGLRQFNKFRQGVILIGIIWLLNAAFTIFASAVSLRFQSFPILLTTIFSVFLVDWLVKMSKTQPVNINYIMPSNNLIQSK